MHQTTGANESDLRNKKSTKGATSRKWNPKKREQKKFKPSGFPQYSQTEGILMCRSKLVRALSNDFSNYFCTLRFSRPAGRAKNPQTNCCMGLIKQTKKRRGSSESSSSGAVLGEKFGVNGARCLHDALFDLIDRDSVKSCRSV